MRDSLRRINKVTGPILLTMAILGATSEMRADDGRPNRGPSLRLSDSHERATVQAVSYQMTEDKLSATQLEVPASFLPKRSGATDPPRLKTAQIDAGRALSPIDVDPGTIPFPDVPDPGGACQACEVSGSCNVIDAGTPNASCDSCVGNGLPCDCPYRPSHEGWFENTCVFLAGDGWKNIFDDDDNNNFGFRTGFNMGFDLPGDRAMRGQVGLSYGAYDFHGREALLSKDNSVEQQIFGTAGIYKRSSVAYDDRIAWGVVCDVMASESAGERTDPLRLAQLRTYLGYALSERNEVGTWMAFRLTKDYAARQRVTVNVTDQVNLFWHRVWELGGDTTVYVGWADDPGDVVVGLSGRVPLNERSALFGNVHYIIPSTTSGDIHATLGTDDMFSQEAWNVTFGIVFYRGGKAVSPNVSGVFGLPLLPVADNGSFSFQADML